MKPSEKQVDETLAQLAATDYRAYAREKVSAYRARRLDEIQPANHAQMQNTVKGGDEYDFHRKRPLVIVLAVVMLVLFAYVIVRITL